MFYNDLYLNDIDISQEKKQNKSQDQHLSIEMNS